VSTIPYRSTSYLLKILLLAIACTWVCTIFDAAPIT